MKKLLLTLSAVLFMATGLLAKIPQNFNYQAVVRNNAGELVKNQQVGVKVTIIKTIRQQQIVNKTDLYVETFTKLTNANGLLSLKIGTGTPVTGQFNDIDFNIPELSALKISFSIKTEIDPAGGTSYTITGEENLSGVPYAKVAEKALSLPGITALSTTFSGTNSTALGVKTKALGYASTAMGDSTISEGKFSTAMGSRTTASGEYSTAMGSGSTASGRFSTAMGDRSKASDYASFAIGLVAKALDSYSFAVGDNPSASGYCSVAMGDRTTASGGYSYAMGVVTTASGSRSTAMGVGTTANSYCQTAVGHYNYFNDTHSGTEWRTSDILFVIGNGTGSSARSNAMTVLKNGRIGLQSVTNPTHAIQLPNNTDYGIGKALALDWVKYSDGRLKTARRELPYGLNEVLKMQPLAYFHHNSTTNEGKIVVEETGAESIGFVAQDMYKVIPEAVSVPEDETADLWGINYDKLIPVLVKAIQEQQVVINELKDFVKELKQRIEQLEQKK